jgi:hydroxymethylbilane synthase
VSRPLRLGTRRSALATTQSGWVAQALTAATGRTVELVEVVTHGDVSTAPLAQIGGTGVFVSALRDALVAGEVDLAVHSLKDLPTAAPDAIALAAVPEREDPRDVLVARDGLTLSELPAGARIGTGSPRRMAQLRALAAELSLDLDVVPVRGNVDTRLRKVADGELDAVLLARAGLARLGRLSEVTEVLDPRQVLPAPGQGALAVECRATDADLLDLLAVLDDPTTRAAVTAERTLLAVLEAGCSAPVGAHADVVEGEQGTDQHHQLHLRAVVAGIDGERSVRLSTTGPLDDPEGIGRRLAADLLSAGVSDLMGVRVP